MRVSGGIGVSEAIGKLAFESGGEFLRETKREVELYLSDRRTRRRGALRLYAKAPIAVGITVLSWALLLLTRPRPRPRRALPRGPASAAILIAFCVQHDANHGAYFRKRRYNHLLGWSADALLGISSYAWRVKHNVAHHTYTNVDGFDDDVTQVPIARLSPIAGAAALVPLPALLHLAALCVHGPSLAVDRRPQRVHARADRPQHAPLPERVEPGGARQREGDLCHLGARRSAPLLPVVARRCSRTSSSP